MDHVVIEFGQNEKKTIDLAREHRFERGELYKRLYCVRKATFKGYVPWWLVRLLVKLGLKQMTVPRSREHICDVAIEHAKKKGVVVEYEPTVH